MFDYEGLRLRKQASALDTVLTPSMRQGIFTESPALKAVNGTAFPGNVVPASMIAPQALKLLQYMPLPNVPGVKTSSGLGVSNNYAATYPNNDSFNQFLGRVDQSIGQNIRFFFRYANNDETYLTGATGPFNGTFLPVVTKNWVAGYTQTINMHMVNDFRVGRQHLTTDALNYWDTNNLTSAGTDLGIPGFTGDTAFKDPGIPTINNTGFMSLGNGGTNWIQFDTTWQGTDSFTYTRGAHTFIVGAEVRKLITSRAATNDPNGRFNFTGFYTGNAAADFLLGYVQSDITAGPQIRNQVAEWRDGFFVVDNWQASKKLTLNLGLRYELTTVPYTVNGYATILNRAQTALIPSTVPSPGFSFIDPNHKNFAPRFGLAYRVTDKTVIRAGFGIYYNPNQTNSFTFLSSNPPFSAVITCTATLAAPITFANPSPRSACGTANIFNIITPNPHLPTPYMNQWTFGLQQGLWSSAALDIQYIGSHTLHLDRSYYNNTPLPGPGSVASRRPNPLFGDIRTIQNDEISNYEGVSFELRQRFSHGITALASYTWSHTLDVSTDSNNSGFPQDPYNWRADYGNSNWDVRHRFVGSFTYVLPFLLKSPNGFLKQTLGGWQTNAIVTLQSGFPFNVTSPGDPANTGRTSERPNVTGAVFSNCGDGHLVNCISNNFAVAPFAYGNFGRNVLFGPGLYNVDFSAFKNFSIKERATLQFRSEFFNLLNTPAFSNPNATITNANFGTITLTKSDNRQIQFALKLSF
jgi:outer membrane receptor protein involved in Fe transport